MATTLYFRGTSNADTVTDWGGTYSDTGWGGYLWDISMAATASNGLTAGVSGDELWGDEDWHVAGSVGSGTDYRYYTYPVLSSVTLDGTISIRCYPRVVSYGDATSARAIVGRRDYDGTETDLVTITGYGCTTATAAQSRSTTINASFGVGSRLYVYFEIQGQGYGDAGEASIGVWSGAWVIVPQSMVIGDIYTNKSMYWNVNTYVEKDTTIHWDTLDSIVKDTEILWDSLGVVAQTATIHWNTLSTLTEVEKDTTINWHTIESITKDTEILWDVQIGPMQSMLELEMWDEPHTDMELEAQPWTSLDLGEVA